jgi:peptide/nickel transport system substrate-binding protein
MEIPMKFTKILFSVSLLTLGAVFSLMAQDEFRLTYAERRSVDVYDPYTYPANSINDRLSSLLFSQLFRMDEDSKPVGDMVAKWEEYPAKRQALVTLKKGMKWSDNSSVTSEDVKFTIELLKAQATISANPLLKDDLNQIAAAEVKSATQLLITFRQPNVGRWKVILMFPVLPMRKFQQGEKLTPGGSFSNRPVGCGPFSFDESIGEALRMKRNPAYHGNRPENAQPIREVVMMSAPDDETRVQRLLSGKADLIIEVPWSSLPKVRVSETLVPYDALSYHYIGFNFKNESLRNPKVREAISKAIDRKSIIGKVFSGKGDAISGPFPYSSGYTNTEVLPDNYDLDEAKDLLKRSGAKLKTLKLVYLRETGDLGNAYNFVCEYIQGAVRNIGLELDLVPVLKKDKFDERVLEQRDFDLVFSVWRFVDQWGDPTSFFASNSKRFNFIQYSDVDVDQLIMQFRRETDVDARKEIGRKLHAVIAEKRPYAFLWSLKNHSAYKKKRFGGSVSINPYDYFGTITEWRIR